AMAASCAVVATSAAVAGLNVEARQALVIADTESAFAEGVIRLLQSPDERQTLGQRAQLVVRKHYDWTTLIPCLIDIYREIGLG
ncbi:MAG: glycosyltransferase, partial [Chloroflexota bacterium]